MQDYLNKYHPLLYLLNSESDLDSLAAEPGYSQSLGREHRRSRLNLVSNYLSELERDFNVLYAAAARQALEDRELALKLAETERVLMKVVHTVRVRLWIERLIPAPLPAPKPKLIRRLVVRSLPQDERAHDLLAAMNSIARRIAPTFS